MELGGGGRNKISWFCNPQTFFFVLSPNSADETEPLVVFGPDSRGCIQLSSGPECAVIGLACDGVLPKRGTTSVDSVAVPSVLFQRLTGM